jgi:flagellar motor switch/type III secretory pathway protein FliN
MEPGILDSAELDAIRSAIGGNRAPASASPDASPIALIADDRSAERARPDALKLGQRWANLVRQRLSRRCGLKVEVAPLGAELADMPALKEQLAASWTSSVEVHGRAGHALVSVSGPIIEAVGARLLGSSSEETNSERPPSPTALKVFSPAGDAIMAALLDAWNEEQQCDSRIIGGNADSWRKSMGEADAVVELTLQLSGLANGRVRLYARPETLLMPPPPLKLVPASADTIAAVLGEVPVELRADLGRASLPMGEIANLRPGAIVMLDRAVDEPVPVYCAGRLVAYARVLVSRGALAVKIVDPQENS